MSNLIFYKMTGGGNDLIIIDNRENKLDITKGNRAGKICRRRFSAGADGIILIDKSKKADFKISYINSDGSSAAFCGNGFCCAARFAFRNLNLRGKIEMESVDEEIYDAKVESKEVTLEVPFSYIEPEKVEIDLPRRIVPGYFSEIRVPHTIVFYDNLDELDISKLAPPIRYHKFFKPEGTNVNFISIADENSLNIRTYEKGVEDETLSCASGSIASAVAAHSLGKVKFPVTCKTEGGAELIVNRAGSGLSVSAKPKIIYRGRLLEEAFCD